jgi:DNA (cytosine-5)-methyltransferase 1
MPPVLLLENVRNLASHDQGRTFRIIHRRLIRSGYTVKHQVVSSRHWVPQDRQRIFIVAFRGDLFDGRSFEFPPVPDRVVGLAAEDLEHNQSTLEAHRLTMGVWRALERHRARHEERQNGFGYGVAEIGRPTRTLSARYYKDGAEILIPIPDQLRSDDKAPYRRLTLAECAHLMGFEPPYIKEAFRIPDRSQVQAYKQFGNAVVVPQVGWLAKAIAEQAAEVFSDRASRRESSATDGHATQST